MLFFVFDLDGPFTFEKLSPNAFLKDFFSFPTTTVPVDVSTVTTPFSVDVLPPMSLTDVTVVTFVSDAVCTFVFAITIPGHENIAAIAPVIIVTGIFLLIPIIFTPFFLCCLQHVSGFS